MVPIPLFVEICAGLASVSGALQHGLRWKPPISRPGRKTSYAEAILRVMGLRPRQGAERYLWAEADSDVASLLTAYTQPEVMRQIADIIRSWITCPYGPHEGWCSRCKGTGRWDARDLWGVLRREKRRGLWDGFDAGEVWNAHPPEHFAALYDRAALPWPPVLIAQDARIEPGNVAAMCWVNRRSWKNDPAAGFMSKDATGPLQEPERQGRRYQDDAPAPDFDTAIRIWPPVHLTPDATIQPAHIPPGTVVYFDPPYANTTGYKHDLPRADVITIAQRWHAAGARVYISEAEPIEIAGWCHVNIGGERRGQKRTFGGTEEWLTCSHPPAWTPPQQASLF